MNTQPITVTRYMTVTLDLAGDGMNLSCWITTDEFFASELLLYPHHYQYLGDDCSWEIHCNTELTFKLIVAIGETADRICQETQAANDRRKIANRR